jgi:hypothetical protein
MSQMESADNYIGLVAEPNGTWRVIECRNRLQWVLPRRNDWRGRAYCRTSQALRRCARLAGAIDPAAAVILAALPARIEDISTNSEDPETATPGVAAH